jgi:3-hydroxyisobutyrate dehydrogenase
MKVGFIGTGNMGRPMATNLIKAGHPLTVHDLRREAASQLLEMGARWAETPREVAEQSEVVFTSLPGPREVEAVALGEQGILSGATSGSLYVDLSTNSPTLMRRIYQAFKGKGVAVLDAPVSGGPYGAATRDLAIMVGGDREAYDCIKPVLDAMGDKVVYCGPIGSGSVCKIVNNLISLGVAVLLAEALTLGVKAGVDMKTLFEVISRSSGWTRRMESRFTRFLFKGNFTPGFALALATKDIGLATELGRELGVPMEVSNLVHQRFIEAIGRGWGERDSDAIVLLQEERTGVQLRIPEL